MNATLYVLYCEDRQQYVCRLTTGVQDWTYSPHCAARYTFRQAAVAKMSLTPYWRYRTKIVPVEALPTYREEV